MKTTLLSIAFLALTVTVTEAQSFTIRVMEQEMPQSPFPMAFGPLMSRQESFVERQIIPSLLSRMFSDSIFEETDDQDQVQAFEPEESTDQEIAELPELFGAFATRMAGIISAVSSAMEDTQFNSQEESTRVRVVCPLLRACQHDVARFCAGENGVADCLREHQAHISAPCAEMLQQHSPDAHQHEPKPKPVSQQPLRSRNPCAADLARLCSNSQSPTGEQGLVRQMACLAAHAGEVSEKCLAKVSGTPAYHCARDGLRLCPGVSGRQNLARCLHRQANRVSPSCKKAAGLPERASRVVAARRKHATTRSTHPHEAGESHFPVVPLAIGLSLLAVVVAVLVHRRRLHVPVPAVQVQLAQPIPPVFQPTASDEL